MADISRKTTTVQATEEALNDAVETPKTMKRSPPFMYISTIARRMVSLSFGFTACVYAILVLHPRSLDIHIFLSVLNTGMSTTGKRPKWKNVQTYGNNSMWHTRKTDPNRQILAIEKVCNRPTLKRRRRAQRIPEITRLRNGRAATAVEGHSKHFAISRTPSLYSGCTNPAQLRASILFDAEGGKASGWVNDETGPRVGLARGGQPH